MTSDMGKLQEMTNGHSETVVEESSNIVTDMDKTKGEASGVGKTKCTNS